MNIKEFEQEGRNILDYWLKYGFRGDSDNFWIYVDENNIPEDSDAASFLINARAVWAFSKGYEVYGDEKYLEGAKRALRGFDVFYKNGGYLQIVNSTKVHRKTFKMYDHAFAIYGLSQFYKVTKDEKVLKKAFEFFNIIEEKAFDKEFGGYYDNFDILWNNVHNPNPKYPPECSKNMNCMLHILEAYTLFYEVSQNEKVLDALKKLTRVTLDKIVNKETGHLNMYFDRELNSLNDSITCGHDIETSWLLKETAEVIGDENLSKEIKETSLLLAKTGFEGAFNHENGGIITEHPKKGVKLYIWWEQAEAVVGGFNMYQLTGDKKYLEYSEKVWEFIKKHFIEETGEWAEWYIPHNTDYITNKIAPWKCPYHNFRMCAEMMRRSASK